MILNYKKDVRNSSTPLLLALGYPVSISSDDAGKFGYEDSTEDYFLVSVAYKWTLRHLKLIAYHSINHSLCDESIKSRLIKKFNCAWDEWVKQFLGPENTKESMFSHHFEEEADEIFKANLNWTFS